MAETTMEIKAAFNDHSEPPGSPGMEQKTTIDTKFTVRQSSQHGKRC